MSPSNTSRKTPRVYASKTDVGNVREHNEDSFIAKPPLFVVADGMGGHEAGEVASKIAIDTMAASIPESADAQQFAQAVKDANRAVMRGAEDGTGRPGMGTTMTAALIYGDELVIAQVGDSRAYLLRDGELQRITRDHSLVADLIEQGTITEDEARYHPQRSVITRALGSDPAMEPDIYSMRLRDKDRLMLCSDGLSSMVTDESIGAILTAHPEPQRCCDELVQEALAAGGLDNVTVIVVDPLREPPKEPTAMPTLKKKDASASGSKIGRNAVIWIVAFVVALVAAGAGFMAYAQSSYYLISEDGYVCSYKGLPGEYAGLRVSWLQERTDIESSRLLASTARSLETGISFDSEEALQAALDGYRQEIALADAAQAGGQAQAPEADPAAPADAADNAGAAAGAEGSGDAAGSGNAQSAAPATAAQSAAAQ